MYMCINIYTYISRTDSVGPEGNTELIAMQEAARQITETDEMEENGCRQTLQRASPAEHCHGSDSHVSV